MHPRTAVAIGLLAVLPLACSHDAAAADAALQTFAQFQDALFARDAQALHKLVTLDSQPVIDELPFDRIAAQQRLAPIEARDRRDCFHVVVRDPNRDGATGIYVVVRENGRYVVDLVSTAALTATPTGAQGPGQLEPHELSPADWERVRRRELATPPGQPVR